MARDVRPPARSGFCFFEPRGGLCRRIGGERNRERRFMESRFYPGVQADAAQLTRELRALFDNDPSFEVQTMQVSSTAVMQARKSSTLRDLTGLSASLTIKITPG